MVEVRHPAARTATGFASANIAFIKYWQQTTIHHNFSSRHPHKIIGNCIIGIWLSEDMEPTSAATYERARRLANQLLWAIDLQCVRLASSEPEDSDFVFRKWVDFDFLVVSLIRLRRVAKLAASIPEIQPSLDAAIREFDDALPYLKRIRDVAEHIDDYAVDRGKDSTIARQSLEVSLMSENDSKLKLNWLGGELSTDEALRASQKLFETIKEASRFFKSRA